MPHSSTSPPVVDDHPALVDWFIENDPQFVAFEITDDAMNHVRDDLLTLLGTTSRQPDLLRQSIQDLIGHYARAVESASSAEMTGLRAISRVLIYVLQEKHGVMLEEVLDDPGASFLRRHGFLPVL